MMLEQKIKIAGLGFILTVSAAVFALGTWKAAEGSTIYLMAAEGRTYAEGLMYAAMVVGLSFLASSAAVHLDGYRKTLAGIFAIIMAIVAIYMTHTGKLHDSQRQVDDSRAADRAIITNEINEYSRNIQLLSESLAKMSESLPTGSDSQATVDVPTCKRGMNYYKSCLAQRDSALKTIAAQSKSAAKQQEQAGASQQAMIDTLERAKGDLRDAQGRLSIFDTQTETKKQEKIRDSLLTSAISSFLPEIASLLGSFFTNFFAKAIYMILREKQALQLPSQFVAVDVAARSSDLQQVKSPVTRSEIEQWNVLDDISPVQQISSTPLGAEQDLRDAITAKTAPLSTRPAKKAFPSVTFRRISEIFEEEFALKILNRRFDAKGNTSYEYPPDGEEGGETFYTETAAARMAAPTDNRVVYLPVRNGVTA